MKPTMFYGLVMAFLILAGMASGDPGQGYLGDNGSMVLPTFQGGILSQQAFSPTPPPDVRARSFPPGPVDENRLPPGERNNASVPDERGGGTNGQAPLSKAGDPPGSMPPFARTLLSTGVILLIFCGVLYTGYRIGTSYAFETGEKTRKWLAFGHVASTIVMVVAMAYMPARTGILEPELDTAYALIGIQIYLLLSSVAQAVSLLLDRPVPPVHYAHIFFAFIAILLALIPMSRPVPNPVLMISVMYLPGAVLALLSNQIISRTGHRDFPEKTLPYQTVSSHPGVPSSFPDRLLTRYHDISVIGTGGLAVVYEAKRTETGRRVAVKIPFSLDEASGKTFLNEMSTWRDLHHENIVEVYDQNIYPVPFVEMEYLGRSLRDITYPLSPGYAISVTRDIATALRYAHRKGIIHGDIKPGNILLTEDGKAKLTDWGLSRSMSRADTTKNASFSLYYAAPEQLAPDLYGNRDHRTDIYQIGILLYELVCGEPPYLKQGIGEMFVAVQKNAYSHPSDCSSALSPFDSVIARCLEVHPSDRFETIDQFIVSLNEVEQNLKNENQEKDTLSSSGMEKKGPDR